jgi:hypothetical protein
MEMGTTPAILVNELNEAIGKSAQDRSERTSGISFAHSKAGRPRTNSVRASLQTDELLKERW